VLKYKFDIGEICEFISNQSPATKIYLGADSQRYRRNGTWYADYTLAVVIHYEGRHGCKIFGDVQTELDYDQRKDRPSLRLMNEAIKLSALYHQLETVLTNRQVKVELHLDLNAKKIHASNFVVEQAIGYIRGTCNIEAKIKPDAWAATYAADRLKEILHWKTLV